MAERTPGNLLAKAAHDSHYEYDLVNEAGVSVAEILAFDGERNGLPVEANAKRLALCWNAHEALVAALERLVGCLSESPDDSPPYVPTFCDDCREFGRAALQLARGEAANA